MKTIENFEEKVQKLQKMVRDAAWEAEEQPPGWPHTPFYGTFENLRKQKEFQEELLAVLRDSDAIFVLDRMVNGE